MIITAEPRRRPRHVPAITLSDPGRTPPTGIVDTREQTPLELPGLRTIRRGLTTGDYSFVGAEHVFAVERKSLDDLVGCVTRERERFESELIRLRGYRFRRLLIIGSEDDVAAGRYNSSTPPKAVFSSLAAWEVRYDVPLVYADTPTIGGILVANWIRSFAREVVQDAGNVIASCQNTEPPPPEREKQEA